MSGDINRVNLIGRLTRDAELRYTNTGIPLTKFSIAVNERKKQGEQWVDHAHFFDITLWGKRGESLNQYLCRGQQVAVEGSLEQQRWTDQKSNQQRSKVCVKCTEIQLIGGKKEGQQGNYNNGPQRSNQGGYNNQYGQRQQNNSQSFDDYSNGGGFDDDIPF